MKAMVISRITNLAANPEPLDPVERDIPEPGAGEILLRVRACGVCHTELDEIEGRTPPSRFPVIPGHEVVGRVEKCASEASRFRVGERVGVAWIYSACGRCSFCRSGNENLCPQFRATGRDADGGYAEYMVVPQNFAYPIPERFTDVEAAPLLCAGAVGYRSLRLTGIADGDPLGLTGFGASGHLVLKMVRYRYPRSPVYVFARSEKERSFAYDLGASWAGDTAEAPPAECAAVIDTTPAFKPVVEALRNLRPGGRLVINAIRKEGEDLAYLLNIRYQTHLWMEKEIKSVANVTRRDVEEFLKLADEIPIVPETTTFTLDEANLALNQLKAGGIRGAKVLNLVR